MSQARLDTNNCYQSPYGWQIDLPAGWHAIGYDGQIASARDPYAPVTVFCQDSDRSNSFSWMVSSQAIDKGLAAQFMSLAMLPGPVAEEEISFLLPRIFPAIGQICATSIVEGEDGNRALEVVEAFQQDGAEKLGYQRIFLLKNGAEIFFQRLAFYAPLPIFERLINSIKKSVQTFAYNRSYGFKPSST
jgi:hypothetical protein